MYTTNVDKEIENEIIELNKKLFKIKREGWHKSVRKGPTGIGKTLETLLDKEEDRKSLPDYKHFEIKTKKYGSKSYTTLFNLTPNNDSDKNEIKRLVEKYGYPDKVLKNKKVLQNEIYFTNKTLIGNRYYFKLTIKKEKLYISVYYKNNILKEEIAYWNIYELYERLQKKLTYLVVVNAIKYTKNNIDFYKYYNYDFYRLKNEHTFIDLIKDGKIRVKLKIGIYRDGPKKVKFMTTEQVLKLMK